MNYAGAKMTGLQRIWDNSHIYGSSRTADHIMRSAAHMEEPSD